jgi:CBS domain-containing protein
MAKTVRDIMDPNPPTVGPDANVEDVVRLMAEHDRSVVLVVNEGGRCVGIITEQDLVIDDEAGKLHLPHYIELFGGVVVLEPLRHFEDRLRKVFASKAKDMMTEDPVTVEASAPVAEAARLISERRHNRLPVVEHGRMVGIVTRVDVLEALTEEQ